ncbi:1-aminocyclopropane-1-carboxylate oxidase homolog 1-like [Durio zibethinus]|uniref:1-aminocyclopropane-1-carboxylate oxidase homolog 1-like n=1 Tax=Durio zibethinus TaxID=66656 RepID=A0A6P5X5X8_DURZI|nr:1-aminocyclopropane-1-carboxylate oxidase homolog 1-like [Durio zibethinus]
MEITKLKPEYDRTSELKALDETKAGVKGLVDAGVKEVPWIFHQLPDQFEKNSVSGGIQVSIPVIDLEGVKKDPGARQKIVEKVRNASRSWGFFQVVNHGIPLSVLEEMKDGVRRFFEQDLEMKKQFYTRDYTKGVAYNCNFDLYSSPAANWKDTLYSLMAPNPPVPEELPEVSRDIMMEYSKQVMHLGYFLFELLSEALGLQPDHLKDMDCAKGLTMLSHYYPACPQPELTLGATKHSDDDFLTVLLQDHFGGLQVLHDNQWVDIPPTPGALVINIGDLLKASLYSLFLLVLFRYDNPSRRNRGGTAERKK